MTTEYSANGSFTDHTHAVCMDLSHAGLKLRVDAFDAIIATPRAGSAKPASVSSEFLMVKLLRVYGECLGTRSR